MLPLRIPVMSSPPSLPVIMPSVPGQKWSCHSCGNCCRTLVEHLFDVDRARIDRQGWAEALGVAPYVRIGLGYVLNKRADGACVFLDENTRCMIHSKFGEEAKPLACRIYPFSVRPVRHGWQASLRFDCPSVAASQGRPLAQHRGWLNQVVTKLSHDGSGRHDVARLERGLRAIVEETNMILARYGRWLGNKDRPMMDRLIGAARITATMRRTKLKKVRDTRLAELLDLLFNALPSECATTPTPPNAKQRAMLRQLAFAHAEHVTLTERRSGLGARLRKRWQQLRSARRFLRGQGIVPVLPGLGREVTFEAIESVGPPSGRLGEIDNLLGRYLAARLAGRTVFGEGYYGWPVFSGLTALCLSVASAGFLARYVTATADRTTLYFDDVARGLAIVDRAATRLPSLGTAAERARATFLANDDGVARLLCEYAPLGR